MSNTSGQVMEHPRHFSILVARFIVYPPFLASWRLFTLTIAAIYLLLFLVRSIFYLFFLYGHFSFLSVS